MTSWADGSVVTFGGREDEPCVVARHGSLTAGTTSTGQVASVIT